MIHDNFGLLPEKLNLPKTTTIPAFSIGANNVLTFMGVYYGGIIFRPNQMVLLQTEFQNDPNVSLCIVNDDVEYTIVELTIDELDRIKAAMDTYDPSVMMIVNPTSITQHHWNPLVFRFNNDNGSVTMTYEIINIDFVNMIEMPRQIQGDWRKYPKVSY